MVKSTASLDARTFGTVLTRSVGGDEATKAHPRVVLGLEASMIKDPTMAKNQVRSFLFSIDMEMVGKLELDEAATQFYHMYTKVGKSKHICFSSFSFATKVLT